MRASRRDTCPGTDSFFGSQSSSRSQLNEFVISCLLCDQRQSKIRARQKVRRAHRARDCALQMDLGFDQLPVVCITLGKAVL